MVSLELPFYFSTSSLLLITYCGFKGATFIKYESKLTVINTKLTSILHTSAHMNPTASDLARTLRRAPDSLTVTPEIDEDKNNTRDSTGDSDEEQEVLDFSKHISMSAILPKPLSYTNLHLQYDNVHGCITISAIAKAVTHHKYFQRLKDIHQLGPLHFKFPYADHSRFEHSIGVAYLARHACTQLRGKHPEITDREVLCVEIAGLCHDLGHGAYSHSFDHLLRELGVEDHTAHHEVRSQVLTRKVIESLNESGTTNIPNSDIELIQYFIDPDKFMQIYKKKPEFFAGLEQIVSNPVHKVDVDKMDYLLRDAQALRFDQTLKYTLDIVGLLNRAQIIDGVWMFHIRDQGIVYDLICRRFIFYNNCYLHPDVNAVGCMLTDAIKIVDRVYKFSKYALLKTPEDIEMFATLTDSFYLEFILNSTDDRIKEAKDLLTRIVHKTKWYQHMGDFITNVQNLDDSSFLDFPWEIFTDKSTPTNLLPKVRYHQNGVPVNTADIKFIRRIYMK